MACQEAALGKRREVAGSSPGPSTLLWPVIEVQQPMDARRSTPGPDPEPSETGL